MLAARLANILLVADALRFVASGRAIAGVTRRHLPKRLASWPPDALRCLELVAAWPFAAGLSVPSWPPLHSIELVAAGHNKRLQRTALALLLGLG